MNTSSLNLVMNLQGDRTSVSLEELQAALSGLGVITRLSAESYRSESSMKLQKHVWLMINISDDAEPLCIAKSGFDTDGDEVTIDQLRYLKEHGVCVRLEGSFAESESGAPEYTRKLGHTFDSYAAFISREGFAVDLSAPFDIDFEWVDQYSADVCWLKLMVPSNAPFGTTR
jgi:hypothetical protein